MYRSKRIDPRGQPAPLRSVRLSRIELDASFLEEIRCDPRYADVLADLVAYTGFSIDEMAPYLLRSPEKNYESEFSWYAPKNERELSWFYRCGSAYLFANAIHLCSPVLDVIKEGKVLDYGAGAGCNTIGMAERGISVDYVEINRLQADFIAFRAELHKLKNVKEVRPYWAGLFDPVLCIQKEYDAIAAMDVLEHIPNYHVVVRRFIRHLKPGGLIVENSPFPESSDEIAIHVKASMPMQDAMSGMEKIRKGVWRKPTGGVPCLKP